MGNQSSQSVVVGDRLKNDMSVTWSKVTDCDFPLREGQCTCSHGNCMYVFGGVIQGDDMIESNDLLCFDAVNLTWSQIETKGMLPSARSAGSLVAVGNKLYLFGGLSHECGWFDTLHVFDIDTKTWSELSTEGPKPSARDKLQATVVDKCVYYFGGFGPKQTGDDEDWEDMDDSDDEIVDERQHQEAAQFTWFNDLYVLDTVTNKWTQPMQMNLGVPTARAAHGICTVGRDLVIFGGRDTEKRTNDLHIFNVDTRKWRTELKCTGECPAPRSFHSVTSVGARVVVMGGRAQDNTHLADCHVFDTATCEWLQPAMSGDLPEGRGQHSVGVVGDKLVMYGGSSQFSSEIMMCMKFHGDTFTAQISDVLKGKSFVKTDTNGQTEGDKTDATSTS